MPRPISITVDLNAIRHNFDYAQSLGAKPKNGNSLDNVSQAMAVIKADAYGHGAVATARALDGKAALLAVSSIEEAVSLRQHHIKTPILLLEGCFCSSELSVLDDLNLQVVLHNQQQIEELLNASLAEPADVWLKIDTGMHRLGISMANASHTYQTLANSKNVRSVVLMTHFAMSDQPNHTLFKRQLDNFHNLVKALSTSGKLVANSAANSAAVMAAPESHGTWNRPGIMLYGISPFEHENTLSVPLIPAMQFHSKIIALRQVNAGESVGYGATWTATQPSMIATVAAGYGDGYPRTAKSGTPVMIKGQIAPLAGRVSMDMLCVDVTKLNNVKLGDDVELWGKNLSVNEVAQWAETLGYELVTRMPTRAKRVFINE
ncbi:Alanine racemase, biosynthetic [Paraglaciecola mesophila]|uniref:Alanine racemase n=1 Tax=Paraglaciecola mesophila TaxID=197222 RepID=A0A857JNE9_9ALTE|nr:alanine racemase [Paraglaciecola mesophila]QHJ12104.1 Alanine racemase, biosynthetic [Paraglaciecola mesophila]